MNIVKETTEDAKADVKYLLERLKAKEVQFVAVEAGDFVLREFNKSTAVMWIEGKNNLTKRKIEDNEIFENTVLSFAGAARFVKLQYPEHRESFKIIPAENDDLMQTSLDAISEAVTQLQIIGNRIPKDHPYQQNLTNIIWEALEKYPELIKYTDDQIISALKANAPEALHVQLPVFVRSVLKFAVSCGSAMSRPLQNYWQMRALEFISWGGLI